MVSSYTEMYTLLQPNTDRKPAASYYFEFCTTQHVQFATYLFIHLYFLHGIIYYLFV